MERSVRPYEQNVALGPSLASCKGWKQLSATRSMRNWQPILMEWRATMEKQAPSTVNVQLSAMRKMVAEARRND